MSLSFQPKLFALTPRVLAAAALATIPSLSQAQAAQTPCGTDARAAAITVAFTLVVQRDDLRRTGRAVKACSRSAFCIKNTL